jgi:hypothetical protein
MNEDFYTLTLKVGTFNMNVKTNYRMIYTYIHLYVWIRVKIVHMIGNSACKGERKHKME